MLLLWYNVVLSNAVIQEKEGRRADMYRQGACFMIFGKSLKQLLRTPVTAALFTVLFAVSAFFISSGSVIWARNQAAVKAYEDVFITIGTVRQRPTSMEITERWDAFRKDYRRRSKPSYASVLPLSVLDFDGAGYILGPEKRPYYGAWRPDLQLVPRDFHYQLRLFYVVEVTPLEDYMPDHPGEVQIKRVLNKIPENIAENKAENLVIDGNLKEGDIVWLCDHYNDDPRPLYAGKTYLMCIYVKGTHNLQEIMTAPIEYVPETIVFSNQYRPDGTSIEDNMTPSPIQEVTDGFL